ncbi:hypothetical protein P879_03853 [Paragonimus westermani]|uniref:CFA20 domain-containing protein n=1 Tax=Paragonimus westermani TaxID=34504 RepID=A0A8T0DPG2_9TREM|nr:hypothetical protein P879_03853 [Paragonimus westermani]
MVLYVDFYKSDLKLESFRRNTRQLYGQPDATCYLVCQCTTFISCPTLPNKTLSIRLPILVIVLKNLKKYFSFEVQILDDQNIRRRFKASTFQTTTSVKPFACMMPIKLDEGWNQVQFDLSDFTKRAYGTNFVECLQIEIHANCRLRRVYFCDRIYAEEELPKDYKLYLPIRMLPTPRN